MCSWGSRKSQQGGPSAEGRTQPFIYCPPFTDIYFFVPTGVQLAAAQWLKTRGAEGDAHEVVTFLKTVDPDLLTAVQPSNIGFRRLQAVARNGDLANALEQIPCLLNTPGGPGGLPRDGVPVPGT